MLQTIRDRATGWFAYIIIGLLIVPFALWGINQYFSGSEDLYAAKVGDAKIPLQEFQRAYQQQRQRLQAMLGTNFDPALLEGGRLKQEVLQGLVNERLLSQAASKMGLRVSDQQLNQAILTYAAFQVNGAFNRDLYQRALHAQGYSEAGFEASLRSSLVTEPLRDGVPSSAIVTPAELDGLVGLLKQQRELTYVVLPLAGYRAKTTVDEAAIDAYYKENKERLRNPEQMQVHYLELKLEDMAAGLAVSEDDLQAAYREQIAKYGQPEERRASHILVTVPQGTSQAEMDKARAHAEAIHQDIAAGAKTFDQALTEAQAADPQGVQGGDLGAISKGMLEPAFESVLFGMQAPGDLSEPVQTSFGVHIVRLDGITPERVKPFPEVRDEVAKELRLRQAEAHFFDVAETLANLSHEHADSLEPAAAALKLPIKESTWFTRQGGEGIAAYPKVTEAAFGEDVLMRGFNSETIDVGSNHIIVIHLQAHKEAAPRSLEEARADILTELRNSKAQEALGVAAQTLLKRATQGEALETLANEAGGELKNIGLVGRSDATIDRAVLSEAFRLPKPEEGKSSWGTALLNNGDQAVVAISGVVPGKVEDFQAAERKTLAQRLAEQSGAAEFQGLLADLRAQTKIVIYSDKL